MTSLIATNICSPLGLTTQENYQALLDGRCALALHEAYCGAGEAITAGIFTPEQRQAMAAPGFSRFESMVIYSVREALSHCDIDVASEKTIFILSTTKADVEQLETARASYSAPGVCAGRIARHLGFTTEPVVVCNACISGVTAQMLADRLIRSGRYDTAVVCGADLQSLFTVAGFLSFKALSPAECRPFDIERNGLNLGECASTMVLTRSDSATDEAWTICGGHLNNDAYHISAPLPSGDGVCEAIQNTIQNSDIEDLGVICAHGTATMFNDQMESMAIQNSGLSAVPLSALKGCFGHTLGASGVMETILCLRALEDGIVLPSRGFEERGVSGKVNISAEQRNTGRQALLKIISGFGGCNGALLWKRKSALFSEASAVPESAPAAALALGAVPALKTTHSIRITPSEVVLDGKSIAVQTSGKAMLTELYKAYMGDYPKFYKMDMLPRLLTVASSMLVGAENAEVCNHAGENVTDDPMDPRSRGVVLFNASSSIMADRRHLASIWQDGAFLPSPAAFIYTLPNIALGEVAIKNNYKGETSLYILDHKNTDQMNEIICATMACGSLSSMITGWIDCAGEDEFEADMRIITI